jgi:hypothetical protein
LSLGASAIALLIARLVWFMNMMIGLVLKLLWTVEGRKLMAGLHHKMPVYHKMAVCHMTTSLCCKKAEFRIMATVFGGFLRLRSDSHLKLQLKLELILELI